jgi:hypothetical protein
MRSTGTSYTLFIAPGFPSKGAKSRAAGMPAKLQREVHAR